MRVTKKLLKEQVEFLNLKLDTKKFYLDSDSTGYALMKENEKGANKVSDRTSARELFTYIQGLITGIAYYKREI